MGLYIFISSVIGYSRPRKGHDPKLEPVALPAAGGWNPQPKAPRRCCPLNHLGILKNCTPGLMDMGWYGMPGALNGQQFGDICLWSWTAITAEFVPLREVPALWSQENLNLDPRFSNFLIYVLLITLCWQAVKNMNGCAFEWEGTYQSIWKQQTLPWKFGKKQGCIIRREEVQMIFKNFNMHCLNIFSLMLEEMKIRTMCLE